MIEEIIIRNNAFFAIEYFKDLAGKLKEEHPERDKFIGNVAALGEMLNLLHHLQGNLERRGGVVTAQEMEIIKLKRLLAEKDQEIDKLNKLIQEWI